MEPIRFTTAVKICLVKYADFKGKASRPEYWYFALFAWLVFGCAIILDASILDVSIDFDEDWPYGPIASVGMLLTFVPGIAVGTRRLREVGKSGWWQFLSLTVVGMIPLVIWLARPPQEKKPDLDEAYDNLLESRHKADGLDKIREHWKNQTSVRKNFSLKEHVFALLICFYTYSWFELTWLLDIADISDVPYPGDFIVASMLYGAFSLAAAFVFTTSFYILSKKDISRLVFYWLIFFSIIHVVQFSVGVAEIIDSFESDVRVKLACKLTENKKADVFFSLFAGISASDVRDVCESQKSLPLLFFFSIAYNLTILFIFKYLNRRFPVNNFKPREGSIADENRN